MNVSINLFVIQWRYNVDMRVGHPEREGWCGMLIPFTTLTDAQTELRRFANYSVDFRIVRVQLPAEVVE